MVPPADIGAPVGGCGGGYNGKAISGLFHLLPYLEQSNLHALYDQTQGQAYQGTTSNPRAGQNDLVGQTNVQTFICPSDPNTKVQIIGGCMISPLLPWAAPFPLDTGGTNYVFCGGTGNSWTFHAELAAGNFKGDIGGPFGPNVRRTAWSASPTAPRTRSCSGRSCGWTTRTT